MASDNVFGYIPQVGMDGYVSDWFYFIMLVEQLLKNRVNKSA